MQRKWLTSLQSSSCNCVGSSSTTPEPRSPSCCVTLIHPDAALSRSASDLLLAYHLHRSVPDDGMRTFYCYRIRSDLPQGWRVSDLRDPFPTPTRDIRTRPRGRFRLPFRL